MSDGNSLSLSNFDVSGQDVQSGLKGFIYGERGVWRPGDPVYLSFILEDKQHVLPAGHPVIAQMRSSWGSNIVILIRFGFIVSIFNVLENTVPPTLMMAFQYPVGASGDVEKRKVCIGLSPVALWRVSIQLPLGSINWAITGCVFCCRQWYCHSSPRKQLQSDALRLSKPKVRFSDDGQRWFCLSWPGNEGFHYSSQ